MSFHFLKGQMYGAHADTGPGTIIVDRDAAVQTAAAATDALKLSSGPWTLTIDGAVGASFGNAVSLTDDGSFISNITLGKHAVITAPGAFQCGINASHAANITNSGILTGWLAGIGETGAGNFRIENTKSGRIGGSIGIDVESLGTHKIINAGDIQAATSIRSFDGIEKVTNYGTMSGDIELGGGNDVFNNFKKVGNTIKQGSVTGTIFLGAGDDKMNGGTRTEIVKDEDGKDIVKLGGGKDTWIAHFGEADGLDRVDGGKGIDGYDGADLGDLGIAVNLDKVAHFVFEAQSAKCGNPSKPAEIIRNFENAYGTSGDDHLIGSRGANLLSGDLGIDHLYGLAGKDQLYGGGGADSFVFLKLKDSGPAKATRDTIHDFELGVDTIDLDILNSKLGGIITGFLGVDVAFTGHKGDLHAVTRNGDTIIELDVNGDTKADFSIQLDGHHALTIDDFAL